MNKKTIIYLALLIIAFGLSYQVFKKYRAKPEQPPEVTPTITSYPTWIPRLGAKRPTIAYENLPFKPTDKTRKVEIVGCTVDDSDWGMSYPKKVVEVPNVPKIAFETMKAFLAEAAKTGWGGFPSKQEITLKKLTLDKNGTARVYFSKELQAYGGESSRVACIQDSVELTLKQFPSIKDVVLCIEEACADQKGATILQP